MNIRKQQPLQIKPLCARNKKHKSTIPSNRTIGIVFLHYVSDRGIDTKSDLKAGTQNEIQTEKNSGAARQKTWYSV